MLSLVSLRVALLCSALLCSALLCFAPLCSALPALPCPPCFVHARVHGFLRHFYYDSKRIRLSTLHLCELYILCVLGIFDEDYMAPFFSPSFLSKMNSPALEEWKQEHGGKSVQESIREFALTYLGKPISKLFR